MHNAFLMILVFYIITYYENKNGLFNGDDMTIFNWMTSFFVFKCQYRDILSDIVLLHPDFIAWAYIRLLIFCDYKYLVW